MSMPHNQKLRFTHPSNFYDKSLVMLDEAWMIHSKNLGEDKSESGKKSHAESGSAALCILILIINLEADLRSRFDDMTKRSDADSVSKPVNLMTELAKNVNDKVDSKIVDQYKDYLEELLLLRNIIAHGYLYEGKIFFNDEWSVTRIEGSNVTGRDRGKLDDTGRTTLLKIGAIGKNHHVFAYSSPSLILV